MRKTTPIVIFAAFAANVALWLAFVGNVGFRELIAGSLCAAMATLAAWVYVRKRQCDFRPSLRNLIQIWRFPWYALSGTWEVLQGLYRQVFTREGAPSSLAAVRFDPGDDPAAAARRALAETYTSITPNFVVLGVIKEQNLLLYHQITPGKVIDMTRNLGARP